MAAVAGSWQQAKKWWKETIVYQVRRQHPTPNTGDQVKYSEVDHISGAAGLPRVVP